MEGFTTASDHSVADWISSNTFGRTSSLSYHVPQTFEAYCRILHRPESTHCAKTVRWLEIAAETGAEMHPAVQWHRIIGGDQVVDIYSEWHGYEPRMGQLDIESFVSLIEKFVEVNKPSDRIFIAFWKGHFDMQLGGSSGLTLEESKSRRFQIAGREYLVFEGKLETLHNQINRCADSVGRLPGVLWPEDCSWYAISEVDFDSTLVGGDMELVERIVNDSYMEAMVVAPELDLSSESDTVN